jgi:hypothetical protein
MIFFIHQEVDIGSTVAAGVLGVVVIIGAAAGVWGYVKYRAVRVALRFLQAQQAGTNQNLSKTLIVKLQFLCNNRNNNFFVSTVDLLIMSLSDRIRALAGVTVGRTRALPSPPESAHVEAISGGDPTYANIEDGPETRAPFQRILNEGRW